MPLSVRPATATDLTTVVEFNLALAAESEDLILARDVVERGVARALADVALARYFVAESAHCWHRCLFASRLR